MRARRAMDWSSATTKRPVVVVGAGIAGASLAFRLHARGVPVLLVERTERAGGRMETVELSGARFESGQQFYYSSYHEVNGLLARTGLDVSLRGAPVRGAMYFRGRIGSFDKRWPWLGLLSPRENLSLVATLAAEGPTWLDRDVFDFHADDPCDAVDVAQHFRERLGEAAFELAIRPMVTSYSFAEPEGHSLAMFHRILKLGAFAGTLALTRGNDALPRALAEPVPTLRGDVATIEIDGDRVRGVSLTDGGDVETNHVVCAAPPPRAWRLFPAQSPLAKALGAIPYTSTIMVNLALDRRLPGPGWVYTLSRVDGHRAAFAIDCLHRCPPCFPDGRSVLMVSFVDPIASALLSATDDELTKIAVRDVADHVPGVGDMITAVSVVRREIAVPAFRTGQFAVIREAERLAKQTIGLALVGDYLRAPLIEGAVRSATQVLDGSGRWASASAL